MNFWEQICCALSEEMLLEIFSPIWSHVVQTKKIRKKPKMQNFEKQKKNGLEILWKGTFPPNLALICMTGSDVTDFTFSGFTDGRTDDAATRLRLSSHDLAVECGRGHEYR